ncbi:D-alanine--D-alanine ligase family protein [Desulfovibrio inopinatus]|uniref:D-alanine--D-alanine ligase family protein n=1 Tax=Desulfovibrio inopinatus TaxID=102109 RepID=UPI00040A1827|nr:D-alanine--D-alanine ligase [Desulfovibrio inopinatus]
MKIGLTYDLVDDYIARGMSEVEAAEFDSPETVDAISEALENVGHHVVRIGSLEPLTRRLALGESFDLVFNIAEGLEGYGREAQVPAVLEGVGIACTFSDPLTLCLCLHKGMTKRIVRDCGIPTADFIVIERMEDLDGVNLPFPVFAKPVAEGTSKGVTSMSRITDMHQLKTVCMDLLETFSQPVLVETYLPGREYTVGIVGTGEAARVIGVLDVAIKAEADGIDYTFETKKYCEELVTYRLGTDEPARQAADTALAAWKVLGGRDAGRIDIRFDAAGIPNFIEANPLPGLHPIHSDLPIMATLAGVGYTDLIEQIVNSAIFRIGSSRIAMLVSIADRRYSSAF